MLISRSLRLLFALFVTVPLLTLVLGCSGGQSGPKLAHVKPGDMPVGGNWTGVYYSPLYGYLHLTSEGENANGAWRTTAGDAFGEMSGKITGDIFRYEWTERRIGMVGANAERSGKGYFRYLVPKEGEAHEIHGEWGLNADEAGNEWKAVKQMNMRPRPESVKPDETEEHGVGGEWDESAPSPKGGSEGSGDTGADTGTTDESGGGALE